MTLPEEITALLERLVNEREQRAQANQQLIQREIEELALAGEPVTLVELHVLDLIGRRPSINVINIAKAMNMTRGAISKVCARLERKHLVVKRPHVINQKEVQFELTEAGVKLFKLHEREHRRAMDEFGRLLAGYNSDELAVIKRFLTEISAGPENN